VADGGRWVQILAVVVAAALMAKTVACTLRRGRALRRGRGWARWATVVTHGAAILLLSCVLLRRPLSWRDVGVRLSPGQPYPVGHGTSWALRLDDISRQPLEGGSPMDDRAQLTLLAQGRPVVVHLTGVNSPLAYGALRVYLSVLEPSTAEALVDVVHDLSFLPVILCAALMVAGLSCTFIFGPRQVRSKGARRG
jgi:hypothetical protein